MTDLDKLHADATVMVAALDEMARIPKLPSPLATFHEYLAALLRALLEGIAAMRRERDYAETVAEDRLADARQFKAERDALQRDLDAALAALRANRGIIRRAQDILATHITPDTPWDDAEAINHLLALLDGPDERAARDLAVAINAAIAGTPSA